MSLYKRLHKSGLIINQEITSKPNRLRPKVMGYMWGGKLTVYLKDGTKIAFSLWHHFYNDICGNWTPPEEELEKAWRAQGIQPSDGEFYDASWYTVYTTDHVYYSKTGFFTNQSHKVEVQRKINDGSWASDDDIVRIV